MDKTELILEKLNAMELALKADLKSLDAKVDRLSQRQEMTWQAVMEIQSELMENSDKIKIIDNKVKAL